jgi:hypothetical protein
MAVILMALSFMPIGASADEEEMEYHSWSMLNGDARHSGISKYVMEEVIEDVLWDRSLESAPTQDIAIGPDGSIYIVEGAEIDGLMPDGQWSWTYEADGPISSSLAIDEEGVAYFIVNDTETNAKTMVAIDHEGAFLWEKGFTYAVNDTFRAVEHVSSPVIAPNGKVFFTALIAPDSESEENDQALYVVWNEESLVYSLIFDLDSEEETSGISTLDPAISDDGLIIFVGGNTIIAVTEVDFPLWTYELPGSENSTVELISDVSIDQEGNCYFIGDGVLYSLDGNGELRWTYSVQGSGDFEISSVGSEGITVEILEGGHLRSIIKISTDGELEWSYDLDVVTSTGDVTVVTANGLTLICGNEALVAVAPNGTELWRSTAAAPEDEEPTRTFWCPVLGDNDTLYMFAYEDGQYSVYSVGNWLDEAVYDLVMLFSLAFAPFFIIAACYFYFKEEEPKK